MAQPSDATRRLRRSFSTFVFLLSAGWASAGAPDYTITGSVIASSGVFVVKKGCLILSSTVGQAVADTKAPAIAPGPSLLINSGFWAVFDPQVTDELMNDNFEVCQ